MKARFDFENFKAIFLKKPKLNYAKFHFFLILGVASLKQKNPVAFCPKKHSVTVCTMYPCRYKNCNFFSTL